MPSTELPATRTGVLTLYSVVGPLLSREQRKAFRAMLPENFSHTETPIDVEPEVCLQAARFLAEVARG